MAEPLAAKLQVAKPLLHVAMEGVEKMHASEDGILGQPLVGKLAQAVNKCPQKPPVGTASEEAKTAAAVDAFLRADLRLVPGFSCLGDLLFEALFLGQRLLLAELDDVVQRCLGSREAGSRMLHQRKQRGAKLLA